MHTHPGYLLTSSHAGLNKHLIVLNLCVSLNCAIKRRDRVVQSQRSIVAEQRRNDNLPNHPRAPAIHPAGFSCQSQPAGIVR